MRELIRTVVWALIAVLAVGAVAASPALAESKEAEWYVKKAKTWQKATAAVNVTIENSTKFAVRDPNGHMEVSCAVGTVNGKGTVGPGRKGEITAFGVENAKANCETVGGYCKAGTIEEFSGIELPWSTEIPMGELPKGEPPGWVREIYSSKGLFQAPVRFKCKTILGAIKDECELRQSELYNNAGAGLVEAKFGAVDGPVSCSRSSERQGFEEGKLTIKPTAAEKEKGVEAIEIE